MNWTGGNLQRHSKLNANKASRTQQQHFAKVKSRTRNPPRAVSPIRLSTFAQSTNNSQPFLATCDDKATRQYPRLRHPDKRPEFYDHNLDVDKGQRGWYSNDSAKSPQPHSNKESHTREESCFGQSFEDVKQRLLRRADWLGTSAAQPLRITFPPTKVVENIGRHRRIKIDSEAAHHLTSELQVTKEVKTGEARCNSDSTDSSQHGGDAIVRPGPHLQQMSHRSPAQSRHMDKLSRSASKTSPTSMSVARMGQSCFRVSTKDSDGVSYETPPQTHNKVQDQRAHHTSLICAPSSSVAARPTKGLRSYINSEGLPCEYRFPNPPSARRLFTSASSTALPTSILSTDRLSEIMERQTDPANRLESNENQHPQEVSQHDPTSYSQNYHEVTVTQKNLKNTKILSSPYFVSPTQPIEKEYASVDMSKTGPISLNLCDMHPPPIIDMQARHRVQLRQVTQSTPITAKTAENTSTNQVSHMIRRHPETLSTQISQSFYMPSNHMAQCLRPNVLKEKLLPLKQQSGHSHEICPDDIPPVSHPEGSYEISLQKSKLSPMVRPLTRTAVRSQRLYGIRLVDNGGGFTERVAPSSTNSNAVWMEHVFSQGSIQGRKGLNSLGKPWAAKQVTMDHSIPNNLYTYDHLSSLSSISDYNDSTSKGAEKYTQIQRSIQSGSNNIISSNEQQDFADHIDYKHRFPPRTSPTGGIFDEQSLSSPIRKDTGQNKRNLSNTITPSQPWRLKRPLSRFGMKRKFEDMYSDYGQNPEQSFPFLSRKKYQNPSPILEQSSHPSPFRFPVKYRHDVHAGNRDALSSQTTRNPDGSSDPRMIHGLDQRSSTFLHGHHKSRMQVTNSRYEHVRDSVINPPRLTSTGNPHDYQEHSHAESANSSSWAISSYFYESPASDAPRLSNTDSPYYVQANVTSDSSNGYSSDDVQLPVISAGDNEFRVLPELSDGG